MNAMPNHQLPKAVGHLIHGQRYTSVLKSMPNAAATVATLLRIAGKLVVGMGDTNSSGMALMAACADGPARATSGAADFQAAEAAAW